MCLATGNASEIQQNSEFCLRSQITRPPVYESDRFFDTFLAKQIDKGHCLQDFLPDLKDLQMELYLLKVVWCKINHLLGTVPSNCVEKQLVRFDSDI